MTEVKTLTEDQFHEQFTLVENHLDDNASWDGCMFETFGEEIAHIRELANTTKRVWTIVEGDDDTLFYCNGMRLVNRIGFLVTEEEWEGETDVEIEFEMD